MDIFEKCRNFTQVEEMKERGLYPYFHALESRQERVVNVDRLARERLAQLGRQDLHVAREHDQFDILFGDDLEHAGQAAFVRGLLSRLDERRPASSG